MKDYQSRIDLPRIWRLLKEITRQLSKRVQANDLCEWTVFPCFQEMSRARDFWRLMYLKMTERLGKISSNIYENTHFLFTVYCNVVLMSLHSSYLLTSKTTWTQWNCDAFLYYSSYLNYILAAVCCFDLFTAPSFSCSHCQLCIRLLVVISCL